MAMSKVVDRCAIVVRPTERFLEWARNAAEDEDLTLEELHEDCTVYLLHGDGEECCDLEPYHAEIFEEELCAWIRDPGRWPEYRGLDVFHEWFDIEVLCTVVDLEA